MTDRESEALDILKEHGPMRAREFGLKFWPEHKAHIKMSNNSYGAQAGKAGWLMAGSYLGKLRKKGLVIWDNQRYRISQKGKRLLWAQNNTKTEEE